jgi:hypothetical protein
MSARWQAIASALAGFLRGFVGLGADAPGAASPTDAAAARRDLARRAEHRRSCC